ncbi:hypothetical protein [Sphingomonas gilva]|nr:hypothetical protein [Sphingomonas gilva]
MLKLALGIVAGIVTGMIVISAVEMIGHAIWPPPPGTTSGDMDSVRAAIAAAPTAALATIVAAWTMGAFAGALVANLIARRALAGWIIVALVIASIVVNATMIPGPVWMPISGILLAIVAGWLASRVRPKPI